MKHFIMPSGPIVVNVSGGRTSAMMARLIRQENPDRDDIFYLFQNTGRERPQTLGFLKALQDDGLPLIWLEYKPQPPFFKVVSYETASRNGEPFSALIDKKKFIPDMFTRFCTQEMKVKTARRFMRSKNFMKYHVVIGFRADEPKRTADMLERKSIALNKKRGLIEIPLMPLFDAGITSLGVKAYWSTQGFDLNLPILKNGKTVGGNCVGCFMHSEYDRACVARDEPEQWQWLIDQEEKYTGTFVKGMSSKKIQEMARSQLCLELGADAIFCESDHGGCTD